MGNVSDTREWRVHGPPGCGKSTWISRQAKRAAQSYGSSNVVIVSLTKTAAAEISSKAKKAAIPERNVGTLHSLAYRAIGRPDLTLKYIDEWNDWAPPNLRISTNSKDGVDTLVEPLPGANSGDDLYMQMQNLRHQMIDRGAWPKSVDYFARHWEEWKDENDLIDFTDMIEIALSTADECPGQPLTIFADEAQDHSKLEANLIRKWGQHTTRFVLVGDGLQSIYSWRGADPLILEDPPLPEDRHRELSQSYRVPKKVHQRAMKWLKNLSKGRKVDFRPTPETGRVKKINGGWRYPDELMRLIEKRADNGKTVMVLGSCSYMTYPICEALSNEGIAFHNPYRKKNGRWNPLRGSTRRRLRSWLMPDEGWKKDRVWTANQLNRFIEDLSSKKCLKHGAKKKISEMAEREEADIERGLIDQRQILNPYFLLTQIFSTQKDFNAAHKGDLKWFEKSLLSSKKKKYGKWLRMIRKNGIKSINSNPNVIVGTIHSVKGGEADTVVLFPDLSKKFFVNWTGSAEERDSIVRLFYVAITRAREELLITDPSGKYFVPV